MGHIHDRMDYWDEGIQADEYVLKILQDGFRLSFDRSKLPSCYQERNNLSARIHMDFVRNEVQKLVSKGCVVRVKTKPRFLNPLSVAEKNEKFRLVIDLSRCLNILLVEKHFKIDDLRTAKELIRQGDFMVVFDLKSAYHHVRMHPDEYDLSLIHI